MTVHFEFPVDGTVTNQAIISSNGYFIKIYVTYSDGILTMYGEFDNDREIIWSQDISHIGGTSDIVISYDTEQRSLELISTHTRRTLEVHVTPVLEVGPPVYYSNSVIGFTWILIITLIIIMLIMNNTV